jgi:hypothetical protein
MVALVGLVLVTAAAALLATGGADAQEDPVDRVAGENRWSTAGGLADQVDGDTLWVATGFDFADALTAGATGAGPVLLVAGDSAPQATLDGAAGLTGIERVRAVGGPSAGRRLWPTRRCRPFLTPLGWPTSPGLRAGSVLRLPPRSPRMLTLLARIRLTWPPGWRSPMH